MISAMVIDAIEILDEPFILTQHDDIESLPPDHLVIIAIIAVGLAVNSKTTQTIGQIPKFITALGTRLISDAFPAFFRDFIALSQIFPTILMGRQRLGDFG